MENLIFSAFDPPGKARGRPFSKTARFLPENSENAYSVSKSALLFRLLPGRDRRAKKEKSDSLMDSHILYLSILIHGEGMEM